jgi:hypothetical protein
VQRSAEQIDVEYDIETRNIRPQRTDTAFFWRFSACRRPSRPGFAVQGWLLYFQERCCIIIQCARRRSTIEPEAQRDLLSFRDQRRVHSTMLWPEPVPHRGRPSTSPIKLCRMHPLSDSKYPRYQTRGVVRLTHRLGLENDRVLSLSPI